MGASFLFSFSPLANLPFLGVLTIVTPMSILYTTATILLASIVIQIQDRATSSYIGGDGFAYSFTLLALLITIYITSKMTDVRTVRSSITDLRVCIGNAAPNANVNQVSACITTGIKSGIGLLTSQTLTVTDALLLKSFVINGAAINFSERDKQNVLEKIKLIASLRVWYIAVYAEKCIIALTIIIFTVFYPILLKEATNSTTSWLPYTAILTWITYAVIGLMYLCDEELKLYGLDVQSFSSFYSTAKDSPA